MKLLIVSASGLLVAKRRSILAIAGSAIFVLLVAACFVSEEAYEPTARSPDTPIVLVPEQPIVIGISSALTGPVGPRGSEYLDAAILAVNRWKVANGETIGEHEILVQAEDDGCTEADITVQAAERLLDRAGLIGVIGPQCSAGAQAAIPLYNQAGTVAISGSATTSLLTLEQPEDGFFFRTAFPNQLEGELTGQFVAETLGAQTVFLIDDGEAYGSDLTRSATSELAARDIDVTIASIRQGQVDFSELAEEVAARDPDFVGFAGFNPEAALLYRQLRDAGYAGPFGSGDAAASERDFVRPVGAELAEGVYFAGCSLELPEDFAGAFRDLHGSEPTAAFVAQYADAATILLNAIADVAEPQEDGSLVIDPTAIRDTVRSAQLSDGVSGRIVFDENGDRASGATAVEERAIDLGLTACQVRAGELAVIFPEVDQ